MGGQTLPTVGCRMSPQTLQMRTGEFRIPMRVRFKHASAERDIACNPVVCITDAEGHSGYGEACPRSYVTGEDLDSVAAFYKKYGAQLMGQVTSLATLESWIGQNRLLIDENPSAFGAVETALLDLFARQQNQSLEQVLGLPVLPNKIGYTAVMGGGGLAAARLLGFTYRLAGFNTFKMKLTGQLALDIARLNVLPASASIRLDANNLWQTPAECIDACRGYERSFMALEEPLRAFDFDAMSEVAVALGCRVILDESCFTQSHLQALAHLPADRFIANIRVSKCGGILRSIELARACQEVGMDVILGAHVAESSLLTRAAMTVGQASDKPVLAREGAYGTLLLKRDLSIRSLRFGRGGWLDPASYQLTELAGNGLEVEPRRINWHNSQTIG